MRLQNASRDEILQQLQALLGAGVDEPTNLASLPGETWRQGVSKADFDAITTVSFAAARPDEGHLRSSSISDLKQLMRAHSVRAEGAIEKAHLVEALLESFATRPFHLARPVSTICDPMQCAICMYDFTDAELLLQLPCHPAHVFHNGCIQEWLDKHNQCPMCREEVGGRADQEPLKLSDMFQRASFETEAQLYPRVPASDSPSATSSEFFVPGLADQLGSDGWPNASNPAADLRSEPPDAPTAVEDPPAIADRVDSPHAPCSSTGSSSRGGVHPSSCSGSGSGSDAVTSSPRTHVQGAALDPASSPASAPDPAPALDRAPDPGATERAPPQPPRRSFLTAISRAAGGRHLSPSHTASSNMQWTPRTASSTASASAAASPASPASTGSTPPSTTAGSRAPRARRDASPSRGVAAPRIRSPARRTGSPRGGSGAGRRRGSPARS